MFLALDHWSRQQSTLNAIMDVFTIAERRFSTRQSSKRKCSGWGQALQLQDRFGLLPETKTNPD